jgi:hypothetical protein
MVKRSWLLLSFSLAVRDRLADLVGFLTTEDVVLLLVLAPRAKGRRVGTVAVLLFCTAEEELFVGELFATVAAKLLGGLAVVVLGEYGMCKAVCAFLFTNTELFSMTQSSSNPRSSAFHWPKPRVEE